MNKVPFYILCAILLFGRFRFDPLSFYAFLWPFRNNYEGVFYDR